MIIYYEMAFTITKAIEQKIYEIFVYLAGKEIIIEVWEKNSFKHWMKNFCFFELKKIIEFCQDDELKHIFNQIVFLFSYGKISIEINKNYLLLVSNLVDENFYLEECLQSDHKYGKNFEKNLSENIQKYPSISLDLKKNETEKEIQNMNFNMLQLNISKNDILFSLEKTFEFKFKNVFCFKINAQIDKKFYQDVDKKMDKKWFKPETSEEINEIISYFYYNSEKHNLNKLTWIITFGVETNPMEKTVNNVLIDCEGGGAHTGDYGFPGLCNGLNFTAFRKIACSFANPKYFNNFSCFNESNKYSILCLEEQRIYAFNNSQN